MTLNVAVWPASTVWLDGCTVIAGALSTVSVAELLVAFPAAFVTTTRKVDPLSDADVVASV